MKIVEVLIEYNNRSLDRPFSYYYNGDKPLDVGYRVLIHFNKKEIVGYVNKTYEYADSISSLEENMGFKIEPIIDVIDKEPLLKPDLIALSERISEYYIAPKISVLQSMLPPSLSPRRSSLKAPKIAYDQYIVVTNNDETGLTNKQIELLRLLSSESKVLKKDIKQKAVLDNLLLKERIKIVKEEKNRLKIKDFSYQVPPSLTDEQNKVIDEFNHSSDRIFLLEGVTGSGKTEIYLRLSEQVLQEGKSVLMLVPEISLTPMMVEYFMRRFSNKVAVLHSELTPAEKYDEYRKIAQGKSMVVVGARSAIFAPLDNIGLIVLDEEHTESYKQDVAPFYHAREVAIMRSEMHQCKVLLSSATPSLESRARAQKGVYHLLRLTKRINNQKLPTTTVINLCSYKNLDRESSIFSLRLREEINHVLERKEQAILLINRRGYSSSVSCRECGHIFRCPTCNIPLTYHRTDNMLKCHYCDYVINYPDACEECGGNHLMKTGFGTERIEDECRRLFPSARVLRLDSDYAKIREKIPQTVEKFRNYEADILVGTQMIAKGHDFPLVTLVGVVLADIGLSMPTFRSSERAFQLLTQAIGRSGRKDKKGQAIIQTYIPDHYAITMAARQNYELFYEKEMKIRKAVSYPPYTYLVSILVKGKNEENVINGVYDVIDFLNDSLLDEAVVLGPTTPYVPYEGDNVVRNILIKYRKKDVVLPVLRKLNEIFKQKNQFQISINIDPYNF
ncbi:MAG: primosomal protein N' [Bacilli bacterium]|nr:primosomal protein N' [Bacilli bacterium]